MRRAQSRRAQPRAEQRGDFAREAEHRKAISAIRCNFYIEHDVVEVQIFCHVAAERCVGAQCKNSRMILRQAELALRTEHALGLNAANDGCLQRRLLAKLRANQSRKTQAPRNFRHRRIDADEIAHPTERQLHRAPPLSTGNWPRKRRSFSKNRRMSSTPSLSKPVRSTPMPNAKPWYSSGLYSTARITFGWIIPQPSTSVHPEYLQTGQPAPSHSRQCMSSSALGSVNGK